MLALALVLALANPLPTASQLKEHLVKMNGILDELDALISSKFHDSTWPQTGLVITSDKAPGKDGLHALRVTLVLSGSPAATAGIERGDRIVKIDARVIEHENSALARMFLDGTPGTVVLTIRRNTQELTIPVKRADIPCLARAGASLDEQKWKSRSTVFRNVLISLAGKLDKDPTDEATVQEVESQLTEMAQILVSTREEHSAEIYTATLKFCVVQGRK